MRPSWLLVGLRKSLRLRTNDGFTRNPNRRLRPVGTIAPETFPPNNERRWSLMMLKAYCRYSA
jgi:hypothetical protein